MPKIQLDVLIFDIDGVLIDVSESYRSAIRQTVQLYLQDVLGLRPFAGGLVSPEDVAAFKLAGGFNNDWDLTIGILRYFVNMLDTDSSSADSKNRAVTLDSLRQAGRRVNTSVEQLAQRKDIPSFARAVGETGGGLAAVGRILGQHNDHLLVASGDRLDTNLVKRLFEEIYLGDEHFQEEYGELPLLYHGPGLIRRERRIASLPALSSLAQKLALGIATGRPRRQAQFALETAAMTPYFRSLVAHEDILQAEQESGGGIRLGKPHPFALLQAVRRITAQRVRCAYIGDTLDDVRAANSAKTEMDFLSIGCLAPAGDKGAMRRDFERARADVIIDHPDRLVEWTE